MFMKVGVISAFKHKPSQQKLQKEKRYLLRTAGYRSLSESEYNDLCLFGPLFLVPVFLISSFLPCVCPHFLGIFVVQDYSGMISFTPHYLLSALPWVLAQALLVVDAGKTPEGGYCIKKDRGILTLSITLLIPVPGKCFLTTPVQEQLLCKMGQEVFQENLLHLWDTEWTNQITYLWYNRGRKWNLKR